MKKLKYIFIAILTIALFSLPVCASSLTESEHQVMYVDLYNRNVSSIRTFLDENISSYPYVTVSTTYGTYSSGTSHFCNLYVTMSDKPLGKLVDAQFRTFAQTNIKYYFISGTYDGDLNFESQTTDIISRTLGMGVDWYGQLRSNNYDMYYLTGGHPDTPIKGDLYSPANFMLPLHRQIMNTAMQSLTMEAQGVHSTMKILTLCGVGLIALLMVFPLFGKIFHPYRR